MDVSTIKPKDLGVIASFRDFVSSEKERMTQKKQALVKHEKDKRLSELIEFSKSFKVGTCYEGPVTRSSRLRHAVEANHPG